MLRDFFVRRKLRKCLSRLVSSTEIDAVVDGIFSESEETPKLEKIAVGFVLVAVAGETAEILSQRMTRIVDVALRHQALVDALVSSLVILTLRSLGSDEVPAGKRLALVEALGRELGENIKIVHGVTLGQYGLLGSGRRVAFSFIIPGFLDALATLCSLHFGEVREVS